MPSNYAFQHEEVPAAPQELRVLNLAPATTQTNGSIVHDNDKEHKDIEKKPIEEVHETKLNGDISKSQSPEGGVEQIKAMEAGMDPDRPKPSTNPIFKALKKGQSAIFSFLKNNSSLLLKIFLAAMFIGYTVYFGFAIKHSVDGAKALIVLTSLSLACIAYTIIRDLFGDKIYKHIFEPLINFIDKYWKYIRWVVYICLIAAVVLFLALNVIKSPLQVLSLSGITTLLLIEFITCKHPDHIRMRPVIWGLALQFILGVVILRWKPGYDAVEWLGEQVQMFLDYTNEAAESVFGITILHPFIFVAMPMLIYFGACMSVLYHFGITQVIVSKLGWLMQITMGTTAVESIACAANIFLNGNDTMMMFRPYLLKLTASEFHAFIVSGHATVAGFAFGIFTFMGAPPQHLLTAGVMSAPAAMAVCKLNYPETEVSETKDGSQVNMEADEAHNFVEAASQGAAMGGKTVVAVVVNMVAFLAIIGFLNNTLKWIGTRVGYDGLSFQLICSYLFMPLAFLMGVEWKDAGHVGTLLGLKLFTSELIAYEELGTMLDDGRLSDRSSVIATYALCGFCSVGTLGIAVGVWATVEPRRVDEVAKNVLRVLWNANVSCFLTACVAGLMYYKDPNDMGGNENMTTTAKPDLTLPPWLTIPPDFTLPPEFTIPPDFTLPPDFSLPAWLG